MDAVENLLIKIEQVAKATGSSIETIAKSALEDGKTYQRLRGGWRGITLKRIDKANKTLDGLLRKAERAASKKKPSARLAA